MTRLRVPAVALVAALTNLLVGGGAARSEEVDQAEVGPRFRVGGSVRLRYENKSNFKFGARAPGNDEDYLLSQLRLNLRWEPTEKLAFFIEGQDARIFGEDAVNEDATPNIFADSLDLHQVHADLKFSLREYPARIRIGRQKFNLGAQRLIASLEWVNTARVWDAVRLQAGTENGRTVDLFLSRLVAVDPDRPNDWAKTSNRLMNSDFHGVYYTDWLLVPRTRFEGYGLWRRDSEFDDDVATLGVRFATVLGRWDVDGEFPWQFGTYGGVDHEAFAVHIGAGRRWQGPGKARVGVAYNFATGDTASGRSHRTFDNLYPLNHAYYGYMDLFSWQNMHNLELTWNMAVLDRVALRLASHDFWLAEPDTDAWSNAGAVKIRQVEEGQTADSHVGREFDLMLHYSFSIGAASGSLEVGYSRFLTGTYVSDTGLSSDADFAYLQTKVTY